MKPTDEAKRLREEINGIIADMVCDHQSDESTVKIVNKVLDAVCMEVNNVGLSAHDTLATKTAINKLRP